MLLLLLTRVVCVKKSREQEMFLHLSFRRLVGWWPRPHRSSLHACFNSVHLPEIVVVVVVVGGL